jgi:hypothetical protein
MPHLAPPVGAVVLAGGLGERVRDLVVEQQLGQLGVRLVQVVLEAAVQVDVRQLLGQDLTGDCAMTWIAEKASLPCSMDLLRREHDVNQRG